MSVGLSCCGSRYLKESASSWACSCSGYWVMNCKCEGEQELKRKKTQACPVLHAYLRQKLDDAVYIQPLCLNRAHASHTIPRFPRRYLHGQYQDKHKQGKHGTISHIQRLDGRRAWGCCSCPESLVYKAHRDSACRRPTAPIAGHGYRASSGERIAQCPKLDRTEAGRHTRVMA